MVFIDFENTYDMIKCQEKFCERLWGKKGV